MPLQRLDLSLGKGAYVTGRQRTEPQRPEARARESQYRVTDRFEHSPHLPIASLMNGHVDHAAVTLNREHADLCAGRTAVFQRDPRHKAAHLIRREPPGDLRSIRLIYPKAWME